MVDFSVASLRRYLLVGLVIVAGCLLSAAAFIFAEGVESARAEAKFEHAAAHRIFAVQRTIKENLQIVRSIVAFYESSPKVERDEFRSLVTPALSRYRSIQALEWIPRVPVSERAAYEKAAREEGYPDFQITERKSQGQMVPAGQRAEHFPVYYVEPYEGNELALGYDLASNATRLEALEASRDSGEWLASGRIT